MLKLGVNVDHVATLREARGVGYPSPLEAAKLALSAGASGITMHLREDRRHIEDEDVRQFKSEIEASLNLEMACVDEIVEIARDVQPAEACLVPEKREELTTEGGLDVAGSLVEVKGVVERLSEKGIEASLFIDPERRQLDAAAETGARYVELHTGSFCNAEGGELQVEWERLKSAAEYGYDLGLHINAGHGINMDNIAGVLEVPHLDTLNIGHSIISRAVIVGLEAAVSEMLAAMSQYRNE